MVLKLTEHGYKVVKMTRSELARKNLELVELLTQEMLENESFAKRIPKGATVFVLPENDPELAAANRKLAQRAPKEGKKVVLVRLELVPKTAYIPQMRRRRFASNAQRHPRQISRLRPLAFQARL